MRGNFVDEHRSFLDIGKHIHYRSFTFLNLSGISFVNLELIRHIKVEIFIIASFYILRFHLFLFFGYPTAACRGYEGLGLLWTGTLTKLISFFGLLND